MEPPKQILILYPFYVSNPDTNNISAFQIGSNGSLTPVAGSPFTTGASTLPEDLGIDPGGRFIYHTEAGGNGTLIGGFVVQ